jgi:uncharacterized protein involved in copper resistance
MSDDRLIRLQNLKGLCAQRGWGPSDLAREVGNVYSYWHDVLADGSEKSFGEKAARKTEEALGLTPRGVLDKTLPILRAHRQDDSLANGRHQSNLGVRLRGMSP